MTLKNFIINWDNSWRYDYWWRNKYKIPFNSEAHRAANQIDIAFEYFEDMMSKKAFHKMSQEEEDKKITDKGIWLRENVLSKEREEELVKNFDLSQF